MDFDLPRVREALGAALIGRELDLHPQLGSTNTEALCAAERGAAEGLVVIADSQTAGRGRQGRSWLDAPGASLLVSVLLRPQRPMAEWGVLSLGVAAAGTLALRETAAVAARARWPNDIVIGGRKVGGVLLEGRQGAVAAGIGINVSGDAEDLRGRVGRDLTTVAEASGRPVRREDILVAFLRRLDSLYGGFCDSGPAAILESYRPLDETLGQPVEVETASGALSGVGVEVDRLGRLVIRDSAGALHTMIAGEVTVRR